MENYKTICLYNIFKYIMLYLFNKITTKLSVSYNKISVDIIALGI